MVTAIAGAVATGIFGATSLAAASTAIFVASYVIAIVVVLAAAAILGKLLAPNLPKSARDTKGIQNVIRSNIMPRRIIYGEAVTGGPYLLLETLGDTNQYLTMIVCLTTHPVEDVLGVMIDDQYVDISGNSSASGSTNQDVNDLTTNYWVDSGKYGGGNHVQIIKNLGWGYADYQYVTDGFSIKCDNDRARASIIAAAVQSGWGQPATTARDSTTGLYTDSGHKATNCAHIYLKFKFDRDVWSGFPKVKFHVKGKPLYNPQLDGTNFVAEGADSAGTHDLFDPDTWEWSEDWTLCILDYLLNKFYGLAAIGDPSDILTEIDWSETIQSYLDSSALVTNGLDSPLTDTTPRFTINGVLETGSTPISNMEALLTSGGGALIYAQGEYKLRPAIYRIPNSDADIINEDMMVSPLSIRTHTPRSEIFNKAAGMYTDKGYDESANLTSTNKPSFEPTDFGIVDPLDSSGLNPYEVIDGEEIIKDFDFPLTTREFEAQRLARIQLERIRQGLIVSFEANMQVLEYSVGDTVYLEILSDSKYANEQFYNRLGLNDAVQNQDSPRTSPYYKQFKITEMQYTQNSTIQVSMIEEAEEIYEWNDGFANISDHRLESEIIADDPTGIVLEPSFVVNSPYVTIEENIGTAAGTTVTTLIRWSAAERGSSVNAIDQVHIHYYKLEYGEVTDPSLVEAARVDQWVAAGNKTSDHSQVVQGPLPLETLYKDGALYDFRIAAVTYSGRQSVWAYYSTDIGSDYNPTAAASAGARTVSLSSDYLAFTYNSSGSSPSPTSATLTATPYGFGSPQYRFDTGSGTFGSWSATATATYTPQADNADMPEIVRVEAREGASGTAEASDSQTVVGIQPGVDGTGANAYTIIVSNEAHTLSTTAGGTVDYTGSGTEIRVFDGTTELTSAAEPIPSPTDGKFSVVVDTINPSASITPGSITTSGTPAVVADHTSMTEDTVVITYAINIADTATLYKDQSLAKSIAGVDGKGVSLSAVDMTFTYDTGGANPSPATSLITATPNNYVAPQYRFLVDAVEDQAWSTTATYTYTPDAAFSNMPETVSVESREGTGAVEATDSITMAAIQTPVDALSINYTNGSHSVPVTNLDVETWTGSGGTLQVFEGTTALTLEQNAQSTGYSTTPGEYRLNITAISGDTLTEPAITGAASTTATLADWAGDLTTATVYRVTAYIFTSGSVQTTLSTDLTLSPSDQGDDGDTGLQGDPGADGEVGWGHDLVFSATDSNTVAWTAGSVWTAGGTTFTISAGNTGNMASGGRSYILIDTAISSTVLQTITVAANSVGVNRILIAVAEPTGDSEAFFQVFGGYGGLLITGNEVVANSITANQINASFYTGRTFTGGKFETRVSNISSPYIGTARAVLQEAAPQLGVYSNDGSSADTLIFGVTDTGSGEASISIVGDFIAGSLDTAQMYSSAGIDDLRGRLGVSTPSGAATGGITTLTTIPRTLVPASTDYELDVDIYETSLITNSISFTIYDEESREGSTDQPYTAPSWDIEFYYSDTGVFGGEEVLVPGADWTLVGTTDDFYEAESNTYYNSFFLNTTRSVDWIPASPFASSDTIYYMVQVSKNSGDHSNPKLTACTVSEAIAGDSAGDVYKVATPLNNQLGIWTGDGTIEGDADLTYDGNTLQFANSSTGMLVRDGAYIRIASPADTEHATFQMDTGDIFRTIFVGATEWHVQDGIDFRLYDSTDTDYMSFQNDGVDFNLTGSGITDINITGITGRLKHGAETLAYISEAGVGTVTQVGTNTGLSGTVNTSGNLSLDLPSIAVGGTLITGDWLIADNGGVQNKQLISAIPLSIFNNDAGWTASGGSVSSVSAGDGMDFTTITGSGPVTMGIPATITGTTTNAVGTTDHTHTVTTTGTGNIVAAVSPAFTGTTVQSAGRFRFNDNIELTFGSGSDVDMYFNGTDMYTDMPDGADWLLRGGDANNNMIIAYDDGAVELYNNNISQFFTQQYNLGGNTSGAKLRDHAGTLRDIGFNNQKEYSMNLSGITLNDQHSGGMILRTGSATVSVIMQSSTTVFPAGSMCTVINHGTGGTLSISDGSESMYFIDGSTNPVVDSTGLTLAIGGICNIWRQGDSAYYVWGSGLS